MNSKRFNLNTREAIKGLVVSVVGAALGTAINMLQSGTIDYKAMGIGALTAGLAYLKVTFFSDGTKNSNVEQPK